MSKRKPPVCAGRLKSGEACHRPPRSGSTFCRYHDPEFRARAQLHGRRGGRPPTGVRVERSGADDLETVITSMTQRFPNLTLDDVIALALAQLENATGPAERLRAAGLLLAAVGKREEIEIARLRLKSDTPEFRGETLVIQVPMRPGHEDEYARDPEGNVIYAHPIGSQPPSPQGSP